MSTGIEKKQLYLAFAGLGTIVCAVALILSLPHIAKHLRCNDSTLTKFINVEKHVVQQLEMIDQDVLKHYPDPHNTLTSINYAGLTQDALNLRALQSTVEETRAPKYLSSYKEYRILFLDSYASAIEELVLKNKDQAYDKLMQTGIWEDEMEVEWGKFSPSCR